MRKNIFCLSIFIASGLLLIQAPGFVRSRILANGEPSGRVNVRSLSDLMSFTTGTSSRMFILSPVTTYVVTTTADNLDNSNPTPGSLRAAIRDANLNAGPDTIEFNIPGAGPHTINVGFGLPDITDTVTIDGYTQPGASPNTLTTGSDAILKIEIRGQAFSAPTGL